jgi:hypothetical protein
MNDILLELADAMLPQTGLTALFKKRKDFWEIFAGRHEEISALCSTMRAALPCLQDVCEGLSRIDVKGEEVKRQLHVAALAGQYLADVVPDEVAKNALVGRAAALFQTSLRMTEASALREAARFTYQSLAERIQEIVLLTLPAWVERIRILHAQKSQGDSALIPMRKGIAEMIEKLKT